MEIVAPRSPFHVCKLRGHFSVAHLENIHATQMPRLSVADLAIRPAHYATISTHDNFLCLESSIGIALEPLPPECEHRRLSLHPPPVGCGGRVLGHRVVGQQ